VDQLHRLRQAQQSLSQQLGRDPNLEELAAATGLKSLDIREVLFRAQEPLSLEGQQNSQSELSLLNSLGSDVSKPLEQLDSTLIQEDIRQLLDELPAQEAELLRLRYGIAAGEALSLSATARQMGITRDTALAWNGGPMPQSGDCRRVTWTISKPEPMPWHPHHWHPTTHVATAPVPLRVPPVVASWSSTLVGDAARPRRTGDRLSHRRQAQQLVQGPRELADALVELARQQSQKRPVPATARSALVAWPCRSAGSAGAPGCRAAGGLGLQR